MLETIHLNSKFTILAGKIQIKLNDQSKFNDKQLLEFL